MDKLNLEVPETVRVQARLNKGAKLFKNIVNAIRDKKGEEIVCLDLKKIDEAVADFFIICEAKSWVQVNAIADHIVETTAAECGEKPFHLEPGEKWMILDYVNVVVHIFQQEQRLFYNLEGLWEDAPKTVFQ